MAKKRRGGKKSSRGAAASRARRPQKRQTRSAPSERGAPSTQLASVRGLLPTQVWLLLATRSSRKRSTRITQPSGGWPSGYSGIPGAILGAVPVPGAPDLSPAVPSPAAPAPNPPAAPPPPFLPGLSAPRGSPGTPASPPRNNFPPGAIP